MNTQKRMQSPMGGLSLPLPMIDVFALVLLFTLLKSQFLIDRIPLPSMPPSPTPTPELPKQGIQIAVRANGEILLQGNKTAIEHIVSKVKATEDDSLPIFVSIETDQNGLGHTEHLFRLQRALSDANVQNPVNALIKIEH